MVELELHVVIIGLDIGMRGLKEI